MHFEGSGLGKFHISGVPTNDTNLSSIGAGADFTCLFRYALFAKKRDFFDDKKF